MILVDTSAWVDYLRDRRTVVAKALTALIEQGAELATTEPVIMELLAGGDTPMRAEALERLANGLPLLGVDPRLDFRAAAGLYAAARHEGRTIRSLVDCLIACVAIRHDVALLHKDVDYDVISTISPLRIHTGNVDFRISEIGVLKAGAASVLSEKLTLFCERLEPD